jgi:uncharacterized protein (TIGR00369 family)
VPDGSAQEIAAAEMAAAGWEMQADRGFMELVGPIWRRREGEVMAFALPLGPRHRNRNGVVHGGVIMTVADRAMGGTARGDDAANRYATVQLDVHFTDAVPVGGLIEARCRILRRTRSLLFLEGALTVGERRVATAKGIWKILGAPRGTNR